MSSRSWTILATVASGSAPAVDGYAESGYLCKTDTGATCDDACNQISSLTDKSLAECETACDAETTCSAFEYVTASKKCDLKKGVDVKASKKHGVDLGDATVTGYCTAISCCYSKAPAAPPGYSQLAGRCKMADDKVNDIVETSKPADERTLLQCKEACDAESTCKAFEYEPSTQECEIKTGADKTASVADGVVDGSDGSCTSESCCFKKVAIGGSTNKSENAASGTWRASGASALIASVALLHWS